MASPTLTNCPINIGVLLLQTHQVLDSIGPLDLIHNISRTYVAEVAGPPLVSKAPDITFHYISHDLAPVPVVGGPPQLPNCTFDTCPPLNYLIVPGPPPTAPLPADVATFLVERYEEVESILSVCTGAIVLAKAGLLAGKRAMTNKASLRLLAGLGAVPTGVKWETKGRWCVDGKIWTSAGITAGMDMAAEWMSTRFDKDVIKWSWELAEFEPREKDFDKFDSILEGVSLPE